MKMRHSIKNTIHGALLLCMLLMITACGDGGGKEKKGGGSSCANPLLFIFCAILSGTSAPEMGTDHGSSSMVSAAADGEPANLDQASEYEPNNLLDNANVVTFPAGSPDVSTGLRLSGTVQGTNDIADYFVFTPTRSGAHLIYLCADTCDESLEDDSAYIMIYDQNQTTIASTSVGSIVAQELAADLSPGLAYYVEVNGYNTGEEIYDYRLVISK